MLSLGYSILMNEVYMEIEARGLNPYFGFMHRDAEKHPTLASDLMEEWRPVIVDSTVLSLIQGHEIDASEFSIKNNKCDMSQGAIKSVISKLEKKMEQHSMYLTYLNNPVSFREAIWHQADKMSRAIDLSDPNKYIPIVIR